MRYRPGQRRRHSESLRAVLSGDRFLVGMIFSTPPPDRARGHPACRTNRYRPFFPGGKWPERYDNHPTLPAKGCEWVELYLRHPSVPEQACYGVTFTVRNVNEFTVQS